MVQGYYLAIQLYILKIYSGTSEDFTNEAGIMSGAEFSIDFVADLLGISFSFIVTIGYLKYWILF